jgi:putative hydrolase of the HAD superfamily
MREEAPAGPTGDGSRAPGVEAVIFDWGGTLTPWHPIDLVEQWRAYAEVYDPERADELAHALLASEEQTWKAGREHHASGTLDDILRRCGIDLEDPRHEAALAAYHAFWEPHTYLDPAASETIDGLHARGIKVGVLSNTLWTREHHEAVFARDGILDRLDGAVYSSEIEWTKPHPEAFLMAMRAVGVDDPSRCVFVGDRPFEDVWGPQQVGMRAVLVPHSEIPGYQRGHTQGEPDAVAHSLTDLLEIVDTWR